MVPGRVAPTAHAQGNLQKEFAPPVVFQAAGPNIQSIQSSVAFRAELGNPNNGNAPGPLATGRREINWDGGGNNETTTAPVTPFDVFLNTRGGQFTTPGIGLSQHLHRGAAGRLSRPLRQRELRHYFPHLQSFASVTPVGSNITNALFFLPGSNGNVKATVRGFGAVFTDVDQADGSGPGKKHGNRKASTLIEFFDADGNLLFSSFVPASPGDGGLSFFGITFGDARIASVKITAGDAAPGPDDDEKHDIVMMDDFIYGEPQVLP